MADCVFKNTHPVQWTTNDRGDITSPLVMVAGERRRVVVSPSLYETVLPFVDVQPGGMFRSWNPWSWPSGMVRRALREAAESRMTKRLLMASGLLARRSNLLE